MTSQLNSTFRRGCALLCLLLLAGCIPFVGSADPRHEPPFFSLKSQSGARQATERAQDRQTLIDALDAEQSYIDMLAEYATGLIPAGRRLGVGGGALFSGPLPPGSVTTAVEPFLGIPYKWGGVTPQGLDCSGFTMLVFKRFGVNLPHSSVAQAQMGQPVARTELQAGDLVFFAVNNGVLIDHVGVMLSRELMAHCSGLRGRVAVEPLGRVYPASFAMARRLTPLKTTLNENRPVQN
jgi:hypothetical protein